MNRVLATRELVDLILEYVVLADKDDDRPRRSWRMSSNGRLTASYNLDYIPPPDSTLPALACVSRFFHPSATRIIWRNLPGLKPLFHCLPETMRHEQVDDEDDDEEDEEEAISPRSIRKQLLLPSDILEEDLVRMKIHGRLVREINTRQTSSYYDAYLSFTVDDDIYDQLLEILPLNTSLLPNLTAAKLSLYDFRDSSAYARLILRKGGPLLSIEISGDQSSYQPDDQLGPMVENWGNLVRSCEFQRISSFFASFSMDSMIDFVTPFPFKTLGQMVATQSLTDLDLHSFTFDDSMFVWEIASIRNLQTLRLNLCGFNRLVKLSNDIGFFPSLEDFRVITTLSQPLCDLFLLTCPPLLQDLCIQRQDTVDLWDFNYLAKALTTSLSSKVLESLTINNKSESDNSPSFGSLASPITSSTLSHLSPFTELTSLALRVGNRVEVDDDGLSVVHNYWPRLTNLQLYEREVSAVPTITPCGVMALIDKLPLLEGLVLRFNATRGSRYPVIHDVRPHPNLRWWDVCTSDADDVQIVYDFTNALCPNLESLVFGWEYQGFWDYDATFGLSYASQVDKMRADKSQEVWTEVNKLLAESRPSFEV